MIKKYQHEITLAVFIIAFTISFYYLYGILLPFFLGLLLAFSVDPIIIRIQKIFKSRDLATTFFLIITAGIIVLFFVFFAQYINRDFKRLNQSFNVLVSNNKDQLDKAGQKVKTYIADLYDFEALEHDLRLQSDSLMTQLQNLDASNLDTESIKASLQAVASVFQSNEEDVAEKKSGFGFAFILFSTIAYFILILYHLEYFANLRRKYLGQKIKNEMNTIVEDFNQSFVKYFKLRTKIILLLSIVYLVAFIALDMPGMILMTVIIVLLSYIPYLQYAALIPLSIGCLVLSTENNQSFLLYFGIVVGVFILASLIEELILNPRIMEKNIGMNPVIMILTLSIWSYLLGLQGLLMGIPITSLLIIYFKRYFLTSYQKVLDDKT